MNTVLEPQQAATTKTLSVPEAIEARHSIRVYDSLPVPEEDLREILRLAALAPSSSNLQPWRFVVVTNPDLRAQLREAGFNQRQFATAPVIIAVVADPVDMLERLPETAHPNMQNDPAALERYLNGTRLRLEKQSEEQRLHLAVEQSVYAISYLSLAAQSLGYSTSIMGGFDGEKVKQLLDVPSHAKVVVLLTLGKGVEAGFPHHRHPLENITTWKR